MENENLYSANLQACIRYEFENLYSTNQPIYLYLPDFQGIRMTHVKFSWSGDCWFEMAKIYWAEK